MADEGKPNTPRPADDASGRPLVLSVLSWIGSLVVFAGTCVVACLAGVKILDLARTHPQALPVVGYLVGLVILVAVVGLGLVLVPLAVQAEIARSRERERIQAANDLIENIKAYIMSEHDKMSDDLKNEIKEYVDRMIRPGQSRD
jgi:hypothetical protein